MTSTAPAVPHDEVMVSLSLPRHCAEWLDVKGARRRYETGRAGKSPIVRELIEEAMAKEAAAATASAPPTKPPKPEGKKR